MRLLFPQVADRDCGECHRWIYNERTGARETDASGQPRRRSKFTPPGCKVCPKKSPVEAWRYELSPRNEKTWQLYRQLTSAPYLCREEWRGDEILMANFALCQRVEASVNERRQQVSETKLLSVLRAAAAEGLANGR